MEEELMGGNAEHGLGKLPNAGNEEVIHILRGEDHGRIFLSYTLHGVANVLDGRHVRQEQIQFIDGIPIGWKVVRFCTHGVLDAATYFLWEFIGTPLELYYSDYPTYVYYVIYDSDGKIVRAVDAQTPEGREYSKLQWTLPFVDELKVNKDASVRNRYWENR
jgi:hypothetical protein